MKLVKERLKTRKHHQKECDMRGKLDEMPLDPNKHTPMHPPKDIHKYLPPPSTTNPIQSGPDEWSDHLSD